MAEDFVIAIPIYEGVDLLDMAAPKEVFQWMKELWKERRVRIHLVAETRKKLETRDRTVIKPDKTFDDVPHVDLLWIPGGDVPGPLEKVMRNAAFTEFLRNRGAGARYVTSVCEGALVAANAGLLDGHEVTTHWAFKTCLASYPEVEVAPGYPRYCVSGNRVTGGGISSGLDEALYLVLKIAGREIAESVQKSIQYFPDPPVHAQLPDKAPACPMPGLPVKVDS